jgi:hypothetical protein
MNDDEEIPDGLDLQTLQHVESMIVSDLMEEALHAMIRVEQSRALQERWHTLSFEEVMQITQEGIARAEASPPVDREIILNERLRIFARIRRLIAEHPDA